MRCSSSLCTANSSIRCISPSIHSSFMCSTHACVALIRASHSFMYRAHLFVVLIHALHIFIYHLRSYAPCVSLFTYQRRRLEPSWSVLLLDMYQVPDLLAQSAPLQSRRVREQMYIHKTHCWLIPLLFSLVRIACIHVFISLFSTIAYEITERHPREVIVIQKSQQNALLPLKDYKKFVWIFSLRRFGRDAGLQHGTACQRLLQTSLQIFSILAQRVHLKVGSYSRKSHYDARLPPSNDGVWSSIS